MYICMLSMKEDGCRRRGRRYGWTVCMMNDMCNKESVSTRIAADKVEWKKEACYADRTWVG